MEGKQHTQSIIAKVMGLEELPHKLPLLDNKKRRVFSENYLQKTASIGLREKSSILVGCSTRINTPKSQKVVKVFKTQMPTGISTVGDTMRSLQNIKVNESLGLKAEAAMRLRSSSLLNNTREDKFLHSFTNKQIIDERWKATQDIEESWNKTHETGALSTTVDPNFNHNLRETNQTSPSSVLEQPFKEEKLCASELNYRQADLCRVAMQLELLDSNSEDTYSEGSKMVVSSDDLCQENKEILIDFNTEESRDYFYLVDVLDEIFEKKVSFYVEEEIWKMLVSPKKEVCKDLSDKALENGTWWLKVEEEVNTICREIESFLFQELAAELAYY
ncbi:hypothetical protein MTR67_026571 [Solanum verrucosum]|uniref:DUF4378 domain-containing protein n=1 Tax=Solanum verrucosum TaxID=315347 RepID=A0AAF0TUL0_SOLVR|nr:hypothetical protein MTR67_026571 [Solanum verrucosum]